MSKVDQPEEGEAAKAEDVRSAIRQALRWLQAHDRPRAEIERRLRERGVAPPVCQEALSTLERWGYVDDARYARQWVAESLSQGRAGKERLRLELAARGLPRDLVEQALADVSAEGELESALQAAHRWVRQDERIVSESNRARRASSRSQRLWQYLSRKGFSHNVVREVVFRLLPLDQRSAAEDQEEFLDTPDGES